MGPEETQKSNKEHSKTRRQTILQSNSNEKLHGARTETDRWINETELMIQELPWKH